jgi:uncharacterized protein YjiS (DUF1127 family)
MTAVVYRTQRPALAAAMEWVAQPLRRLAESLAGSWRHAAARRAFHELDDRTLRDLGMSRSEIDSYWVEAHGQAERTRQRIASRPPVWM